MHNPHTHISPSSILSIRMIISQQSQRKCHGIKYLWLFMQMIEIVCDVFDGLWDLGLHVLAALGRVVDVDVVFADGGDSGCVHPGFHYEGPACEGYDWLG